MAMCSRAERWTQVPASPKGLGSRSLGDASSLLGGSMMDYPPEPQPPGPSVFGGKVRPSYAPFGSTNVRTAKLGNDAGPAPGAYDPRPIKGYDSGLPKKHVPFSSGATRLEPKKEKDPRPGPGQYQAYQRQEKGSCRTMGAPGDHRKTVFRSTSAPSIPTRHQSFGYEEAGDGRLVRQGPKAAVLSGSLEDSAGPGQYDVRMDAVAPKPRGGKMLGGAIRDPGKPAKSVWDPNPGPGHYGDPDKPSKAPKVVSSFVSQTPLGGEGPKQLKKVAESPGPGHYAQTMPSRPSLREQHPELQYFGSTSERFKEAQASRQPGPGAYVQPGSMGGKNRYFMGSMKGTLGSGERFEAKRERSSMPGPGHYQPNVGIAAQSVASTASILGSTGNLAFGSHETRIKAVKQTVNVPGPGAYGDLGSVFSSDPEGSLDDGKKRTHRQGLAKGHANFKSNTAQDALVASMVKEGMMGPPPGAYTPVLPQDVGAVMRLPPKGEGFGSAAPQRPEGREEARAPGPGWYKVDGVTITGGKKDGTFNRLAVEGVPERGKPKGLGFATSDSRFANSKFGKSPGPGEYNTAPGMVTKTFNVHFGDII
jgi:hypothetical protein